jgi:hypothetical protein
VCSGGYCEQNISYKPWIILASLLQYELKRLFTLVMVLSTKMPIMIAICNPPLHFLFFFVYRLEVGKTRAYRASIFRVKEQAMQECLSPASNGFLLGLLFNPEDEMSDY